MTHNHDHDTILKDKMQLFYPKIFNWYVRMFTKKPIHNIFAEHASSAAYKPLYTVKDC